MGKYFLEVLKLGYLCTSSLQLSSTVTKRHRFLGAKELLFDMQYYSLVSHVCTGMPGNEILDGTLPTPAARPADELP